MILGDTGSPTRRPEYASQLGAAAKAAPSPTQVLPRPERAQQVPRLQRPEQAQQVPVAPEPVRLAPHGAAPLQAPRTIDDARAESRPVLLEPKPEKKAPVKPVKTLGLGKGKELQDYSYKLSPQELARVRKENPKASEVVSKENTLRSMSWDEYDALSPNQRAAVDFNTMLVEAREIDLKTGDQWYTEEDRKQFAKDVEEMFGVGGGSEQMAPATMTLLKKINFKAIGQDLDEFLSLERGIGVKELKDFKFSTDALQQLKTVEDSTGAKASATGAPQPQPQSREEQMGLTPASGGPRFDVAPGALPATGPGSASDLALKALAADNYAAIRTPGNMAALNTAAIKAALTAYRARLSSGAPGTWSAPNALSILPAVMTTPLGYGKRGSPDPKYTDQNGVQHSYEEMLDASFKDAYTHLMKNPNETGMADLFQDFKDRDWSAEEQQQLWDYINARTMRDMQQLNGGSAKALRAALGWK